MTSINLPRHYQEWVAADYRIVVIGCLAGPPFTYSKVGRIQGNR